MDGGFEAVANQLPTTGAPVVTTHQNSNREWHESKSRSQFLYLSKRTNNLVAQCHATWRRPTNWGTHRLCIPATSFFAMRNADGSAILLQAATSPAMASINSVGEPLHLIQSTSSSFTSHLITFQDVPSNFPSGEEIVAFYTLENSFR